MKRILFILLALITINIQAQYKKNQPSTLFADSVKIPKVNVDSIELGGETIKSWGDIVIEVGNVTPQQLSDSTQSAIATSNNYTDTQISTINVGDTVPYADSAGTLIQESIIDAEIVEASIIPIDTTNADGVLLQFSDTVNGSTGRNTFYNKTQVDVLVAAGGGGGNDSTAIQVLEFTTADPNSPSAGDTILIQNGFIGKNLEVFAEGKRLNRTDRNSKGFYHTSTSDTMYIHPPFKDDSVYAVKIYSTYGYKYIALEGGGAAAYTDDFNSYTSGLLSGNPNWNHVIGAMTANGSGGIYPNAAGNNAASYNGAVTANHYSQLSTAGNSTRWIGPATRITGTDGTASYYAYQNDGNNVRFIKVTNGTETVIATHTIVGAANTLRLESNGTTHSCYLNGSLDTGLTGGTGVFVDSDHPSGDVGVSGYNASSIKIGDNWSGGDL